MQEPSYNIGLFGSHKDHEEMFQRMLEEQNYFKNGVTYFERCFERQKQGGPRGCCCLERRRRRGSCDWLCAFELAAQIFFI